MNNESQGHAFAAILQNPQLTKEQLFSALSKAMSHPLNPEEMHLPSSSAVASLESRRIKCRIKTYESKLQSRLARLKQVDKLEHKQELLNEIRIMNCQPRDYAIMALDSYLKMDKNNTLEGFCSDYKKYSSQEEKQNLGLLHNLDNSKEY